MNRYGEEAGGQVVSVGEGLDSPVREMQRRDGEQGTERALGSTSGSTRTSDVTTPMDQRTVFEVLQNERRRLALYHLDGCAGPVALGGLVEQVAAWENDTTVAAVTPTERKRVYDALQQVHLPRLVEAGLINYDPDAKTVTPTDEIATLRGYLRGHTARQRSWSRYYAALGVLYTVGATLAWLLATPFVGLSNLPLAVPFGLSVTVLAGVNWYVDTRLPDNGHPLELDRSGDVW